MSARRSPFVQVARDPFGAWLTLDSDTRMLGPALALHFGNEALLAGITLADLPDILCRTMAIDAKKRPMFRQRLAKLIERGLIVETEEGVRLLWSREAYLAQRPKRPPAERPAEPATSEPPVSHAPPTGHPPVTHPELSLENPSTVPAQKERKKERIKKTPPTGGPAPQRAARAKKPRDENKALLTRVVAEECARGGQPSATFTTRQTQGVIERGKFYARKLGLDLEATFRRMASEAVDRHARTGGAIDWAIIRWSDAPPPDARHSLRYTGPKPCSPLEEFPDIPLEEQLRRLREFGRPRAAS